MDVAFHRHRPGIVEFKGTCLSLGPCGEVVPQLLVTANGSPEHVVRHAITIEKVNRRTLLNHHDVRLEGQTSLVHEWMVCRSGEGFSRDRIDVHDRVRGTSCDFSGDCACMSGAD